LGRKRKLNRARSLKVRVLTNPAVDSENTEDGNIRLTVHRADTLFGKLMGALFLVPKERKIALDEIGSAVWRMCDGKHTLTQIAERIQHENKLHRKEAELAVISFIDSLAKRRLVVFKVPEER